MYPQSQLMTTKPTAVILFALLYSTFVQTCLGNDILSLYNSQAVVLNAEEQAWIDKHPVIRVAADPDYPPFQFTDDTGQSVGIANDYLAIIGQRLGIRFAYVQPDNWAQALALVKARKADMVAVATQTPERLQYMRFTTPYVEFPDVIITRSSSDSVSLEQLHGQQLATVEGFGINAFLRREHPQIQLHMAPTVKTLLTRISTGEVGAGVLNLATTTHAIQKWQITNLHISGQTTFSYKLALATRQDWPMLHRLLQKSINSIGKQERQSINQRWIAIQTSVWQPTREQILAFVIVLIVTGFVITLVWNRQLRKKVDLRTSDLKRAEEAAKAARESAEQANRTKTDFLAAASHDLRQPLHAMGLQIEQLKASLQDQQTTETLAQLSSSQLALSDILNALLDISHLDSGTLKPNYTVFPLARLFTQLKYDFTPLARERGIALRFHASCAWVYSDAALLHRIIANLVDNAIKQSRAPGVLIGARRRGELWRIEVWDCGPGIPVEQQQLIFDKFVQLNNPGRDRRKGLGLGLSIVQRLCQLLGHSLDLVSRSGRGTCFRLEVATASPLPQKGNKPLRYEQSGYSLQGAMILVVDDDPEVLTASRKLLTTWQCAVLCAGSLKEAVAMIADEEVDVILADYRLADGHTGFEVIETLNRKMGRQCKALIITGNVDPGELEKLRKSRYPVLSKPVSPATLRTTLHQLMMD